MLAGAAGLRLLIFSESLTWLTSRAAAKKQNGQKRESRESKKNTYAGLSAETVFGPASPWLANISRRRRGESLKCDPGERPPSFLPPSLLLFLLTGDSGKNTDAGPASLAVLTAELVIRHAETNFRRGNSGLII